MLSLAPANNLACHHFTLQCLPQEVSVHGQFATAVENYCVSLVIFNLVHIYLKCKFERLHTLPRALTKVAEFFNLATEVMSFVSSVVVFLIVPAEAAEVFVGVAGVNVDEQRVFDHQFLVEQVDEQVINCFSREAVDFEGEG